MCPQSPSFDGFRDAQQRLRQHFGQDLTFYTPGEKTWPEGTQLNPDNGQPYDPEVQPVTAPETETIVQCNVIKDGAGSGGKDEANKKAIGWLKEGGIVIIVDIEDWHLVRDATKVTYAGETYTIRDDHHDYLGPVDRWLLWATQ